DEEERAEVAVEEVGVLALPAEAGALRPRLVEDGGRVGEGPSARAARLAVEPVEEGGQLLLEHLVVVVAPGVAAHGAGGLAPIALRPLDGLVVAVEDGDDGARARHQLARVHALVEVVLHPAHGAVGPTVAPGTQPRFQTPRLVVEPLGARDAARVEAEAGRL